MSSVATVREALKSQLAPLLPYGWRYETAIVDPKESLVPVVYFEFTRIASAVNGQPLGRNQVAAHIDVTIATAGKDQEDDVDGHVLQLTLALQAFDDLLWDTAEKIRLTTGQMGWKVSLIKLTTATPT